MLLWECLYKHPARRTLLSVYVDDLKMAGPAGNIADCWKDLCKLLDLDPPTPFHDSVYLGCGQFECDGQESELKHHQDFYNQTFGDDDFVQVKTASETELTEDRKETLATRALKRNKKREQKVLDKQAVVASLDQLPKGSFYFWSSDREPQGSLPYSLFH